MEQGVFPVSLVYNGRQPYRADPWPSQAERGNPMQPTYLSDLAWPDVEHLLAQEDRLLLVTGATEQHGRHLPLGTDTFIPWMIAGRLSARTGVPIAPYLPYGMSEAHMAFPGTFTLSEETLRSLYLELLQSAYRQGWRRVFVLNGHGGNRSAWEWAAALAIRIKADLKVYLAHWWTEELVQTFMRGAIGRNEGHAGVEERRGGRVRHRLELEGVSHGQRAVQQQLGAHPERVHEGGGE